MRHLPGAAIDFDSIARIVVLLIGLYTVSALFAYLQQFIMAGVAQKTVYDMRRSVSEKLARLPLSYFDGRTHGEIMSRVTNDMDNIAGTLQQSLGQIITSIVTILGVIVMMLTISPLLTAITLVVLPLSFVMTRIIAPRSQKYFAEQWKHIGELNGHVEEMYTGHPIVKAFGRERRSIEKFNDVNEKVYEASWRAQFVSGLLFPMMTFINNIGYVAVAVAGGILVTRRAIAIGDIQAFIQYSRQFTMAHRADREYRQHPAEHRRLRGARLRAPRRGGGGAGRPGRDVAGVSARGRALRECTVQLQGGCAADHRNESGRHARTDYRHCRAYGGRQDNTGESAAAVLRDPGRPNHRGRPGHPRREPRQPPPLLRHGAAGDVAVQRHHP